MSGMDLGQQAADLWDGPLGPVAAVAAGEIVFLSQGSDPPDGLIKAAGTLDIALSVVAFSALAIDRLPTAADALWLDADDCNVDDIAAIAEHTDQWQQKLILNGAVSDLDRLLDRFGDRDGVIILADPSVGDCLLTLSRMVKANRPTLHSPVAEAREREIEQLQEDVQRISRMLARLSMEGADTVYRTSDGAREPASPFIETEYLDPALRSPARGFTAGSAPDLNAGSAPQARGKPPITARAVRQMIRRRRLREEYFTPELFADPAWDMLLDLYAARLERHRVSVSSLCIAAAVPATTALRWIKTLTDAGMFSRDADQHDGRRIFVSLTDDAAIALHHYFARLNEE